MADLRTGGGRGECALTILFIADLHLEASRPAATDAFCQLLHAEACDAEALYILGDLFEAWIGDDDDAPLAARVAASIRSLADSGTKVHFQHGNRDFLLGEAYASQCGMALMDDAVILPLNDQSILLMHGDSLCTDDVAYQAFRIHARDPAWQQTMLSQPLEARRALAAQARSASVQHTATTSLDIMDVNDTAVANAMREADAARMIHGHTHRPATHRYADGRERHVLAPWHERGQALVLESAGSLREIEIPFQS